MARKATAKTKKRDTSKPIKVTDKEKIYCSGCDSEKKPSDFYKNYGKTKSGVLCYCKKCCVKMSLDKNGDFNLNNFKKMLQQVDRPFIYKIFADNMNKTDRIEGAIGYYFKDIGMKQNRELTYADSIFEKDSEDIRKINNVVDLTPHLEPDVRYELTEKWGFGYNDEELYLFEKKFNKLKNNYPLRTEMHVESLLTYVRYQVKAEIAVSKGLVAEAEKWGKLADTASQRAKINPSQLSQADLTGGLNTFGEVSRAVEKTYDIVDILPRFIEKPQDKVDFTLWCYINYIRLLKNLPECEYKDIYKFYEEKKEEYKKTENREFEFEEE